VEESFQFNVLAEPPFRLDYTAWALRRRPGNIIDRFDGHTYRRVLTMGDRPFEIAVSQPNSARPSIEVTVHSLSYSREAQSQAIAVLDRTLGIKRKLSDFYALSTKDGEIGEILATFRGLKPVRFPSVFEALVNGIACQQISLAAGLAVLNRLAEKVGMALSPGEGPGGEVVHAFPRPVDILSLDEQDLRKIGFSRQKIRSLVELSKAVDEEKIDLEGLERLDNRSALDLLCRIRGIGRWTGEYALLRGLGRLDVFPGDDTGAQKRLLGLLHLQGPLSYEATGEAVSVWQPYAGLVYLHLLVSDIFARGYADDE
jgi:DNA-3-methyladenine glycosylase II